MKTFLEQNQLSMMDENAIRQISPLKLAYVGDTIYESYIRIYIINKIKGSVNQYHKLSVQYVKASAQAHIVKGLREFFTEEETGIIKRGRNQKSGTVPKNANVGDYRWATGFEALIGHLFILGKNDRIEEIVTAGIKYLEENVHETIR